MRPGRLRPWMLVSAVWIAPAVFASLGEIGHRRLSGDPPATMGELLWAGGDWLIYALITPAIFWISARWPLVRPHLLRRAMIHLGFALLFCVAWAVLGKALEALLLITLRPQKFKAAVAAAGGHFFGRLEVDVLHWILTTVPFGIIVYLCVAGLAHAIRYFVEAGEREVQLARLSEQLAGARFAALQAQLNPHFLFNTLNTIAVRARDGDTTGTVRMVEQLSDVLRRTLTRHRVNEVTLDEELGLARQYLAIEQARFSDRLRVSFEIDESRLSAAVPSFALQHLIENAVRHGIARHTGASLVLVRARRDGDTLELSVADDGPGIDPEAARRPGHGIENTQERLRALYGGPASLVVTSAAGGGTVATLRVPLREMPLESDIAGQ
ncbi:MAG TPA: histidine kinase [Vicinamibacterales bacterium]|nr:histidine kinase [Vicinamibacterales bacterium]